MQAKTAQPTWNSVEALLTQLAAERTSFSSTLADENWVASYEPGGRIRIESGVDADDGFVRITDNGKGIPGDLLPSIFDMFVQERTTPDGAGGLGGLVVATGPPS